MRLPSSEISDPHTLFEDHDGINGCWLRAATLRPVLLFGWGYPQTGDGLLRINVPQWEHVTKDHS